MNEQKIADRVASAVTAGDVAVGGPVWDTVKGFIRDVSLSVANTGTIDQADLSKIDLASKALKGLGDRKLSKEVDDVKREAEKLISELRKISNKMIPSLERNLGKLSGKMLKLERG